jgi:hypothetical protein
MIGEKFTVNDKTYTIKKELKLGEYRKISGINAKLNRLSKNPDIENSSEFMEASDNQLQVICDFLESHVGITQEEINDMNMTEAVQVFQEAFKLSTTPDKELKKTSN